MNGLGESTRIFPFTLRQAQGERKNPLPAGIKHGRFVSQIGVKLFFSKKINSFTASKAIGLRVSSLIFSLNNSFNPLPAFDRMPLCVIITL